MLSNQLITLRAVEPQDLDFLYQCENALPIWVYGTNKEPISYFALKEYVKLAGKTIYESKQLRLMIVFNENNRTVGTIDLYDFDHFNSRAGIGIYVEDEYQHRGIGTATFQLLSGYAFDFLNIHQLYAFVSADNEHSIKALVKAGFSPSATLKEWQRAGKNFVDVIIFTKINK